MKLFSLILTCSLLLAACTHTQPKQMATKANADGPHPLAEVLQHFPARRAPFTLVLPTLVREGLQGKLPAGKLSYADLKHLLGLQRAVADSHQTDSAFANGTRLVARLTAPNQGERLLVLTHQTADCGPYVLWLVSLDATGTRKGTQQLGQYCDQGIVQSRLATVFINSTDDYAATEVRNATDYQNPTMKYNTVYYAQTTTQVQRKWRIEPSGKIFLADSTTQQAHRMIQ